MAIMKERCFPRGGRKSASKQSSGKNKKVRLFDPGNKKKKDKRKAKKSTTSAAIANDNLTAEQLTYQSLAEGMILLGCVVNVSDYYIRVSLPGRLVGKVPIINISGPYTKILKSLVDKKPVEKNYYDLTQMFKPGHFFVVRVLKVTKSAETSRYEVELTLNPECVNANYAHSGVRNGMVLQGSVKSIEDHGYMIDFGIKSLTAFLKNEKAKSFINLWNGGRPLGVGQVVMCRLQRVDVSPATSVIQVTLDPEEVSSAIATDNHEMSINTLMPGTMVKGLVVQNVRDGLMVEFLNFKGFVYRDHVGHPPPKLADVCLVRVLYTIPLLNTVYLSVLLGRKDLFASCEIEGASEIKTGKIVRNAEVISASKRGIMVMLDKNIPGRGYVSRKRITDGSEISPGSVKGLYPIGKKVDVRIIGKDLLENMYICSSQQSSLDEEDLFCIDDVEVGMTVEATVVDVVDKGVKVKIGRSKRLNGFVPLSHLADFPVLHPERRFSPKGETINARVLRVTKGKANVLLTFKPSLVNSDLPILDSYDEAANTKIADGTVVKILDKGLLVMFFNDIMGFVPISNTGHSSSKPGSLSEAFYVGQTVRCSVVSCIPNQKKLKLSLLLNTKKDPEITSRLGHFFTLKVIKVNDDDLVVKILKPSRKNDHMLKHMSGTIPAQHLSDHASLTNFLRKTYQPGSEISSAVLYSVHYDDDDQPVLIFSLRASVIEFCQSSFVNIESNDDENQHYNNEDLLEEGTVIPCSILKTRSSGLLLEAPVPHSGRRIYVPCNLISDACPETTDELTFPLHKLIFGKVMHVDRAKKKVLMATKLSEVWSHHDLEPGLTLLKSYLDAVDRLRLHMKMIGIPLLESFMEGQIVKGTVKSISEVGASVEVHEVDGKKLKDNLALCHATVLPHHFKSKAIKVGEEVVGRVIFVDIAEGNLYLTLNTKTVEEMEKAGGETFAVGKCVRVEILVSSKNVAVSFTKGNVLHGELVYLPVHDHYNDYLGCVRKRVLKPGDIIKVIISGKQNGKMIGLVKKDVNAAKKCAEGKDSSCRKRKAVDESDNDPHKRMKGMDTEVPKRIDIPKSGVAVDECTELSSSAWQTLPRLRTAEGFVWGVDINSFTSAIHKVADSSGDEDRHTEDMPENGKSKLKNAALREESCLREAEQRLMDPETCPQTANDYDRLVLSSPDSSIVWLKYVAFHLQNVEIDKARAVAQRALKTINFREEQEKFNVWVCLFNLENLYGTKESLEKVIQEALQMNEPLKVYCQMLHIYLDSNKIEELDNLMEVMLKKHKSDKEAWIHAGRICMKLNRPDKAGELLRRSFKSLQKNDHVDVTCRWAQLEAHFGSIDRAQSLLEGVLMAYPKRTDIWSSLVDTLVRAGSIEEARNILERAICQRLPVRKMKVLFKKYLLFEEKFGTLEGMDRVRHLAMDYVEEGVEGGATC